MVTRTAQLPATLSAELAQLPTAGDEGLPLPFVSWVDETLSVSVVGRNAKCSESEVYLSLPRPGGDAWPSIDRDSGEVLFEATDRGWISYFNDLHKGRNTGAAWRWFLRAPTWGSASPASAARGLHHRALRGQHQRRRRSARQRRRFRPPHPGAAGGSVRVALWRAGAGDRDYAAFCRFGHTLDGRLRHQGATPLFDPVEVDNTDPGPLRHWQHHLGLLSGQFGQPDWSTDYQRWRLAERRLLNPGSLGAPAFLLALEPLDGDSPDWSAGDIAEIGPCNDPAAAAGLLAALQLDAGAVAALDGAGRPQHWRGVAPEALAQRLTPLPHRAYSIASLPSDRRLELLVRQARHTDGQLGLGSGWLTEYAQLGTETALRVRHNTAFHSPAASQPLVLIGNGTGLAGLRAHLKTRAMAGETRNWLLFGERSAAQDFFFPEEIESWQRRGLLRRLDLALSRDQRERLYVQHCLRAAADALHSWVADGAAIYVCGSLTGMAPAVDAALADTLSAEALEQLAEQGRYRRDVY